MNDHVRFKSHESSYRRTRKKIETPNRIALVIEIVRRTGLMLGTEELGELVRRTVSELTQPVPFLRLRTKQLAILWKFGQASTLERNASYG